MTNAQAPYAEVWLDADDLRRVLLWYADSHSTGDPDEDELHDDLAERFKAASRDLATRSLPLDEGEEKAPRGGAGKACGLSFAEMSNVVREALIQEAKWRKLADSLSRGDSPIFAGERELAKAVLALLAENQRYREALGCAEYALMTGAEDTRQEALTLIAAAAFPPKEDAGADAA